MAAPAVEAFGQYLRQLRERRGLSLDTVATLSSTFPDPIGKAYLSRCENGKLKIAFSKTIALSKIYEVPPEVLAERMRLDLEIDRIGGPDTTGKDFKTLFEAAWDAAHDGKYWDAYALVRDSLELSDEPPTIEHVASQAEQIAACRISVASMALQLGSIRFACLELEAITRHTLGDYFHAFLLERLQIVHRELGNSALAIEFSQRALDRARASGVTGLIAATLETRARTLLRLRQFDGAISDQQQAISLYDDPKYSRQRIQAYLRLADAYTQSKRFAAAKRTASVALKHARQLKLSRNVAQALCLIGDIELREKRPQQARAALMKAASMVRSRPDRTLKFEIDRRLRDCAIALGDESSRRAIERRLKRLMPAVNIDTKELEELRLSML